MIKKSKHTRIKILLRQKISGVGGVCYVPPQQDSSFNQSVDLIANINNHQYIFKVTTQNHKAIQNDISELYEYRYCLKLSETILVLVVKQTSEKGIKWIQELIGNVHSIQLVWYKEGKFLLSPRTQRELEFLR